MKIPAPYEPLQPPKHIVASIQAVATGTANDSQQKKAMEYIVFQLCDLHGLSYRPNSQRDTDFAEGKKFVGLQISKFIHTNFDTIKE